MHETIVTDNNIFFLWKIFFLLTIGKKCVNVLTMLLECLRVYSRRIALLYED